MSRMTSVAHASNVSEPLAELQAQLAEFRSTHPRRTRLPASLWQSAAGLARRHGIYVVARSLKLNNCTLKKRLSGSAGCRATRKKGQPKFIELIGATRHIVDEYLIEFECARGRKLRIQCKTNTPPDWATLLRAWGRAEL